MLLDFSLLSIVVVENALDSEVGQCYQSDRGMRREMRMGIRMS